MIRLRRALTRWSWPLPAWALLVPAFLIAATGFAQSAKMLRWPVPAWSMTSSTWFQATLFCAPIAAGAAALLASRLTPPSRAFAIPTAERVGPTVVLAHLSKMWLAFLPAYALGLVPVMIDTGLRAEGQARPDLLAMTSGLIIMASFIAVGYLLGVVFRSALGPLLAVLMVFAVAAIGPNSPMRYTPLFPTQSGLPGWGQQQNPAVSTVRIIFYLMIAIAAVVISARLMQIARVGRLRIPLVTMGMMLVAPVLLASAVIEREPELFKVSVNPSRVCEQVSGVEFCVHTEHGSDLARLIEVSRPVLERYGKTPAHLKHVWDWHLLTNPQSMYPQEGMLLIDWRPGNAPGEPEAWDMAGFLAGDAACSRIFIERERAGDSEDTIAEDLADDLEGWLLWGSGNNYSQWGIPDTQMSDWIAKNEAAIAACELSADLLP